MSRRYWHKQSLSALLVPFLSRPLQDRFGLPRLTSGYPLGSRKASGTASEAVFRDWPSGGGDGFAEYSVKAKVLCLGVRGEDKPLGLDSGVEGRVKSCVTAMVAWEGAIGVVSLCFVQCASFFMCRA